MVSGDAPFGEHDHSTTEPAIREILGSLGLSSTGLRWIESYSHSAWMTDEVVVRYRIIGPTGRLLHEAAVAECLDSGALYPEVVASGCWARNDWLVTERIPGETLFAAWPRLTSGQRETATHQLAGAVKALHESPALHLTPPCLFGGAPHVPRSGLIDALVEVARRGDDAELATCVIASLEAYRDAIDDEPSVMAHHDLNFGQAIWRDGRVVGLVDLEMSHANAPDWDLTVLLGMCADPRPAAPREVEDLVAPDDFADVARWFRHAYPDPFEHPMLPRRLRIYELVYNLASFAIEPDLSRMLAVLERGTTYERLLSA